MRKSEKVVLDKNESISLQKKFDLITANGFGSWKELFLESEARNLSWGAYDFSGYEHTVNHISTASLQKSNKTLIIPHFNTDDFGVSGNRIQRWNFKLQIMKSLYWGGISPQLLS